MKNQRRNLMAAVSLLASLSMLACTPKEQADLAKDRDLEHTEGFYLAGVSSEDAQDPIRRQLSHLFLVEQYNVGANQSMLEALAQNPPAGILFWNGNHADAAGVRESVRAYSKQASALNLKPLLFSADYEGGGQTLTPSGKNVPGVQRFVKGFTRLAHPRWLGASMKMADSQLCQLHGKIMATELKAVGINYPLSVVADLATQGLTSVRGISKSPTEVSLCLSHILNQFIKAQDMIFVTKHFPGLGLTRGDTHDMTVVSKEVNASVLQNHMQPFQEVISISKKLNAEPALSIMATHAMFMAYDSEHVTTESDKTLNGLLKQQMKFQGLVVSDAMWMGEYGKLETKLLMPVYLNSFLSGIDVLMIPGSRFAQSIQYFRKVYDNRLTVEEQNLLTTRTQMTMQMTQQKFRQRLTQSLQLQNKVRSAFKPAHESLSDQVPTTLTTADRARYEALLEASRHSLGVQP